MERNNQRAASPGTIVPTREMLPDRLATACSITQTIPYARPGALNPGPNGQRSGGNLKPEPLIGRLLRIVAGMDWFSRWEICREAARRRFG